MRNYILYLICFFVISCGTGRITSLDTKPTEAIVFGKISIENTAGKSLESDKLRLHFNERLWGKNTVVIDKNGYFYMKLPIGHNFLAMVESFGKDNYTKNIYNDYLSLDLVSNDTVYYLGDIKIIWDIEKDDKYKYNGGGAAGGALSAIQNSKKEGGKPTVEIIESEETISYFRRLFPDSSPTIKYKALNINN